MGSFLFPKIILNLLEENYVLISKQTEDTVCYFKVEHPTYITHCISITYVYIFYRLHLDLLFILIYSELLLPIATAWAYKHSWKKKTSVWSHRNKSCDIPG